jgi:PTS system mannose-specific IIA component
VLAMEHVVGPQRGVRAICIGAEDDMARRRADIVAAAREVDEGSGVILLTDMFGGTPSNLAISVMDETRAEVIAGLNLPMLIKLASIRDRADLQTVVHHAQEAGKKYISVASYVLAGEK